MEADGEKNGSDSDEGSAASWVILDEEGPAGLAETQTQFDETGTEAVEQSADDDRQRSTANEEAEPDMSSSGDSARTAVPADDSSSKAAPPPASQLEEGSDVEVIPNDQLPSMSSVSDEYFEDDPIVRQSDGSDGERTPVSGSLPSDTVLRRRRRTASADDDGGESSESEPEEEEQRQMQGCDNEKDKWDDTDLSTLPDQTLPDAWSREAADRHYVHQRNAAVNQLLTVLMVLVLTCVLGLGTGHFLGWLHHTELTEEIVLSLDEKLDDLRDDLMTCMTTEDDQDLDNKWIKELLHENEALMHQLQGDESAAPEDDSCSQSVVKLRDQMNQLRTENEELRAIVARLRYGTVPQDGHRLRHQQNQINELVTENSELGRELRRHRYLPVRSAPDPPESESAAAVPVSVLADAGSDVSSSHHPVTASEWMEADAAQQQQQAAPAAAKSGHTQQQAAVESGYAAGRVSNAEVDTPSAGRARSVPSPLAINDTDLSLAAYYARRTRQRQRARLNSATLNWQLARGESRAQRRGAYHHSSWLLERAQARENLRQRRGDDTELPNTDQQWRQQRDDTEKPRDTGRARDEQRGGGDWSRIDDDDHDNERDDDDDDDDDGYAMQVAKHIRKAVKYQQRVWLAANRKAEKMYRKMRENHWKHFGGRNRQDFTYEHRYQY